MRIFGKLCFLHQMLILAEGSSSSGSQGPEKVHAVAVGRCCAQSWMPCGLDVRMGKERYGKYQPRGNQSLPASREELPEIHEGEISIAVNGGTLLELRQPR